MSSVYDFSNRLHVRLFVAEVLSSRIDSEDFDEMAERMVAFITKESSIPKDPKRMPDMSDTMKMVSSLFAGYNGGKGLTNETEDRLSIVYKAMKDSIVSNPKNIYELGRVIGYSRQFNCLIAHINRNLDHGCISEGLTLGEDDYVCDPSHDKSKREYFYLGLNEEDQSE